MLKLTITTRRSPAFGGRRFGAGAYELLIGHVDGASDPAAPGNAGIVDLDRAPRDADGRLRWRVDIAIARPLDPARGNGWLLHDVPNRGFPRAIPRLNGTVPSGVDDPAFDTGGGFLLNEGFTLVWTGWQADLPAGQGALRASFPVATEGGGPLVDWSREEWTDTGKAPAFAAPLTWPAADDRSGAKLTVRARTGDPRTTPADLAWDWRTDRQIVIARPAGFDSGAIYEFTYRASGPAVAGLAFASVRDIVSFLRRDAADADGNANPLAVGGRPSVRHAMIFGVSQSGRFVRDFLWQGFNTDLAGRPVFEAAMPVVAGSRKTFTNARFAQPGRFSRQHEDNDFPGAGYPFAYHPVVNTATGRTDDVLARSRAAGHLPKIVHFDTESELWAARGSLLVSNGSTTYAQPDNVRLYLASGVQHSLTEPPPPDLALLTTSPLDYTAPLKPLLLALARWVDDGTPPPTSRFPTPEDGTLVTLAEYRRRFPALPGIVTPDRANGIAAGCDDSPAPGEDVRVLVPAPDADGNASGGLRHPFLAVPLGTFTGWNLRRAGHGEGDLFSVMGGFIPFALTRAQRLAAGDPRPSLEERYAGHDDYVARLAAAAAQSVAEGLLLPSDAEAAVARARALGPVFAGRDRAERYVA